MEIFNGVKTFHAKTKIEWREWLSQNYQIEKSIWLIIFHKESNIPTVYYNEAVDEALCWGWVDSSIRKRDNSSYYQYFARRNINSNWSKINKEKIEKLEKENRLSQYAKEIIIAAKKSGTWDALNEVDALILPADLLKEFNQNKLAFEFWELFPKSTKRGILEWILNAKQPETRKKRILETVSLAEKNIRANQYKRK